MNSLIYNRDTAYWDEYYKGGYALHDKSKFAEFVSDFIKNEKTLLDCGCGNGRDSIFFASNGLHVSGVDASVESINMLKASSDGMNNIEAICGDFVADTKVWKRKYDCVYSRFSLHAISKAQQQIFLKNTYNSLPYGGRLFIEVRSINDDLYGKGEKIGEDEFFFDGHYRRFLRLEQLADNIERLGFAIEYCAERKEFAKYKDQNPPIIRVVAKKVKNRCADQNNIFAFYDDTEYIHNVFHNLKKFENGLYIFGAGDRAQWLGKILIEKGIEFEGFLVNEKYYNPAFAANMYGYEKKVLVYEKLVDHSKITILLGVAQSLLNMSMFNHPNVENVFPINIGNRSDYLLQYDSIVVHKKELEWLYNNLADDYSRECLSYCLKGRLTGRDFKFSPSKWTDPEYFIEGFIEWGEKECLVDCGAYDGDTTEEFLKKIPNDNNFSYKVYALEPDKENYLKLKEKYKDNHSIICINKAVYSSEGFFGFSNDGGEMSAICEKSGFTVEADTIDHLLGSTKATFIKMDVEGSELQALMGAEKQIKNNKPKLAICIYHKQEDFWTIPQYIKMLRPDYKLFLKTHSSMPTELVLFCV